jgi:hypothetical protein
MKTFCPFISLLFILLSFTAILNAQTSDSPADIDTSLTLSDTVLMAESLPELYTPAPVTNLTAKDNPDDGGGEIILNWDISIDDNKEDGTLSKYIIMRSDNPSSGFRIIGVANHRATEFINKETKDGKEYYYKVISFPITKLDLIRDRDFLDSVTALYPELSELGVVDIVLLVEYFRGDVLEAFQSGPLAEHSISAVVGPAKSSAQWFNMKDLDTFIIGMIICLSVVIFIALAKRGRKLFLRRIGGLQAIDEAIGRATEMGKSILFIPGIQDMDDVQTIAGITILGRIAKTIAEYDTKINMPVSRSIVMTTARETIKEAYLSAGRPDAYSDDMVHYLTDEQFGYVAAVDGIMVREKPATCFYLGAFFAESLIMAETGNSIGAIQIAGTAMPAQLPFFVAACDYTLIGEELFAASAYLSGEPKQLGSLKGQDVGKFIAMLFMILGTLFATLAAVTDSELIVEIAETLKSWFMAG